MASSEHLEELLSVAKVLLQTGDQGAPMELDVEPVTRGVMGRFAVRCGEDRHEVSIDRYASGMEVLRSHGNVLRFWAHRRDSTIQLWLDGRIYRFELVNLRARRSQAAAAVAARSELTAPMPGTVLKIQVQPGAEVAAHQPMVIMESMKMEMSLSVPHAGRVEEVLCREGQLVAMGAALIRLEPISDNAASA